MTTMCGGMNEAREADDTIQALCDSVSRKIYDAMSPYPGLETDHTHGETLPRFIFF